MRCIVFAAGLALAFAGPAAAHAFLKRASPAVGSSLPEAPRELSIEFTEPVESGFSTIAVLDAAGASVTTGGVHPLGDDQHLAIGLKTLPPGRYTVTWHVTAADTHKTQGGFSFTVAP